MAAAITVEFVVVIPFAIFVAFDVSSYHSNCAGPAVAEHQVVRLQNVELR